MLRKIMKDKARSIKTRIRTSILCAIAVILFSPAAFHYNPVINASWTFILGTDIMMLIAICFSWYATKELYFRDFSSCDIVSFLEDVKKVRKRYLRWIGFGSLLAVLWALWLMHETMQHTAYPEMAEMTIYGMFVGLVIGLIIGLGMDYKNIKNCNEIIDQINNTK